MEKVSTTDLRAKIWGDYRTLNYNLAIKAIQDGEYHIGKSTYGGYFNTSCKICWGWCETGYYEILETKEQVCHECFEMYNKREKDNE